MPCATHTLNGRTCKQRGAMCTDKLECDRIANYERVMNAPIQPYLTDTPITFAEPEPMTWGDVGRLALGALVILGVFVSSFFIFQ